MTLASYLDANNHLDENKIGFANEADAAEIGTATDRYVRGRLMGVYGSQVTTWAVDPQGDQVDTPELVREITGMLMAAELYDQKYAEETELTSKHANRLRRMADDMLTQLSVGDLVLVEVDVTAGTIFSQDDFWPNDLTEEEIGAPDPKFRMGMVL